MNDYIASQPPAVRATLTRVRNAIRRAVPEAEEKISYRMPAYKLGGKNVALFAVWKQHYSLYLANAAIVKAFKDRLAPYHIQKGTISFPLSEPVPENLIEEIVRFRAETLRQN